MDAELLSAPRFGGLSGRESLSPLLKTTWWFASIVLVALCAFLLLRRFEGGLQQPLGMVGLISVGMIAAVVASLLHLVADHGWGTAPASLKTRARLAIPTLGLILLASAVSLPGSPTVALVILWVVLAGEETAWWNRALGRQVTPPAENPHVVPPTATVEEPAAANALNYEAAQPVWDEDTELPHEIAQQMTRVRTAEGVETIFGMLRGNFLAGERSQNMHLAFCPPLDSRPEMTVDQVSGPPTRIKTAQVESYGARLELRLTSKPSCEETVVVRFEATVPEREP